MLESHIYIYIYIMGITCFTAPTQCFQVFYMCTFQRCCARVRDVVHVSEMLCRFHRSCARFTSPLITSMFDCIHTERIYIYIYIILLYIYIYIILYIILYIYILYYIIYYIILYCIYVLYIYIYQTQNFKRAQLNEGFSCYQHLMKRHRTYYPFEA